MNNKVKSSTLTGNIILTFILSLCVIAGISAQEKETDEEKIVRAMSAAPADIANSATIMDVDGSILRKGTNNWVCLPGIGLIPGDKHPMCNDPVWMKWMKAAASGKAFSSKVVGISYMLAGDAMVNNDDPAATDTNDGGVWVQEGPHLMMLVPDKNMLANFARDPFSGGPYVMWDNTPLVHVMLPIKAKKK